MIEWKELEQVLGWEMEQLKEKTLILTLEPLNKIEEKVYKWWLSTLAKHPNVCILHQLDLTLWYYIEQLLAIK